MGESMKNKICLFTLLAFTTCSVQAVKVNEDGVLLSKADLVATGAAGGSFLATFGALKLIKPEKLSSNFSQILVSAGVAAFSGVSSYLLVYYLDARKRSDVQNYRKAEQIFNDLSVEQILSCTMDNLLQFVIAHYNTINPLAAAISELNTIQAKILQASVAMETVLKNVKDGDGKANEFYEKSKTLYEKIKNLYTALLERKVVVLRESEFTAKVSKLASLRRDIEKSLASEQVACVNTSYEQTLAFGVSTTDKLWPLVAVVNDLRATIKNMSVAHDLSVVERGECAQMVAKEPRYKDLVETYDMLLERIKKEFPFSLFEQRIKEIFTSPAYQEQGKILDEDRKHKEIVTVLEKMQGGLSDVSSELKKNMNDVKANVSGLYTHVSGVKDEIASVKTEVKKDIASLEDMKWNISKIKQDVVDIKTNMRRN